MLLHEGHLVNTSLCPHYKERRRFPSKLYAIVTKIRVWIYDPHGCRDHLKPLKPVRLGGGSTMQSQIEMHAERRNINDALDLSESRAYDCAQDILGAYKLSGDFHVDLQIVLKDLGVLDKITYEIEPKAPLSDCRHVVFRPNDNVHKDRFSEIIRSIKSRIGYDATRPWWVRLLR